MGQSLVCLKTNKEAPGLGGRSRWEAGRALETTRKCVGFRQGCTQPCLLLSFTDSPVRYGLWVPRAKHEGAAHGQQGTFPKSQKIPTCSPPISSSSYPSEGIVRRGKDQCWKSKGAGRQPRAELGAFSGMGSRYLRELGRKKNWREVG